MGGVQDRFVIEVRFGVQQMIAVGFKGAKGRRRGVSRCGGVER